MRDTRHTRFEGARKGAAGVAALLLAAFWLSGCETPPTMTDAEVVEPGGSTPGIVFGSVEVYKDDDIQKWGVKFTGSKYFYLTILPPDTKEAITYKLAKDGLFYWTLPPGDYLLLGYHWQDMETQRVGRIGANFRVPTGEEDVYLGSIAFHGDEFSLVPQIRDRFDEISSRFRARYPGRQRPLVRQIFELPQSMGSLSAYRGQCHADRGIECTDRFKGVTPISPEVAQSGFPDTGSLQPEFRWKASSRADVHYDLIVYEAVSYTVSGALIPMYMKGRMVAYVEDLDVPSWQPPTPLAPDSRYIWSVRLRENGTVSGWSSQGHFAFLIVAMTSGYGQWFQFMTP